MQLPDPLNGLVLPSIQVLQVIKRFVEHQFLDLVLPDAEFLDVDAVFQDLGDVADLVLVEVEDLDGEDPLEAVEADEVLVVDALIVELDVLAEQEQVRHRFQVLLHPAIALAALHRVVEVDDQVEREELIVHHIVFIRVRVSPHQLVIRLQHLHLILPIEHIDPLLEDGRREVLGLLVPDLRDPDLAKTLDLEDKVVVADTDELVLLVLLELLVGVDDVVLLGVVVVELELHFALLPCGDHEHYLLVVLQLVLVLLLQVVYYQLHLDFVALKQVLHLYPLVFE